MPAAALALHPGLGIAFLRLGAGLHDTLCALKADSKRFPRLDVAYSARVPLARPVVVNLPANGLRLRFDGAEQRLRLIEILDLDQDHFTVKGDPLILPADQSQPTGKPNLLYRRVYQLFGASYPGEFIPSDTSPTSGAYIVSYPGIALSFPIRSPQWSPGVDHAKMLTECGATVSTVAIFEGRSWADARKNLFRQPPSLPRSLSSSVRSAPDELEHATVRGRGTVEFARRTSPDVILTIGETTAQDLINDFGPPDSIYKRPIEAPDDATIQPTRNAARRSSGAVPRSFGSTPSSLSSTNTDTYDADFEEDDGIDGPDIVRPEDQYYCYFKHGFDVLVGPTTDLPKLSTSSSTQPVAIRIILHGNVPGSFEFNRHRRCRWSLTDAVAAANSESAFPEIHDSLIAAFKDTWPEKDMKEGMVIVRDWTGDSPSSSAILIGESVDDDEDEEEATVQPGSEKWLKNTHLYKFPGLMFEVMHNGAITALTVY